jgi:carbamoyl-phosphate synthase large subunit
MTQSAIDGPFTVLISSAGRRASLLRTFREALAAAGLPGRIIACDLTELTPAMQMADVSYTVPRCTDYRFADSMTEICARETVDLVIPTIDTELPVWASLAKPLKQAGTTVAVSSPAAIAIAADKRLTNSHCVSIGMPAPRQSTLAEIDRSRSSWPMPLVVKPSMGSASNGLKIVSSWTEFNVILQTHIDHDVVVEERAHGTEYTVDVYVDTAGTVHCPVVRQRLEVRAGEVSKARVVRNDLLASFAAKVVGQLPGAYGVLNVQMFFDGERATIIEINARFGGGYPLTWRAGGRYSEWLVREVAMGQKPPTETPIEYDLAMLRWDEELFVGA